MITIFSTTMTRRTSRPGVALGPVIVEVLVERLGLRLVLVLIPAPALVTIPPGMTTKDRGSPVVGAGPDPSRRTVTVLLLR